MKEKETLKNIIDDFMKNASPEELREFQSLLKKKNKTGINIDFQGIARDTAGNIQKQLGLTSEMIKSSARDLVARLAKQYNPGFTDQQIRSIVNEMVPTASPRKSLPPALMLTMVEQFVSYSTGTMEAQVIKDLPKGWQKKYWDFFSPSVQKLIADYLYDKIDTREFWIAAKRLVETGV